MGVLEGKQSLSNILSRTYICLCVAHMLKALSRKLSKCLPLQRDKKKRQRTLALFAALARTSSLQQASEVYKHIYVLLCSETVTSGVTTSLEYIRELALETESDGEPDERMNTDLESELSFS